MLGFIVCSRCRRAVLACASSEPKTAFVRGCGAGGIGNLARSSSPDNRNSVGFVLVRVGDPPEVIAEGSGS
jgi:hypothetical protein